MNIYKTKLSIFATALLLFTANLLIATETEKETGKTDANIAGHVIDKATGEHLPFVSILVKGTAVGTTTDASGHYRLSNVPIGKITLATSFIGYDLQEIELKTEHGRTIEVNFEMEGKPLMLNQIVVSASKDETRRREAVSIVNVITPKAFEAANAVCLAEGLNFQPGLRVENNCQNCGFPQLRINGLEGPYTQILMDSRAINSALSGVYGLEHIPVNMVERVEIIRGGASALFGSSAVGGTVNIITKEPMTNALSINNTTNFIYGKTPDISTNLNASLVSDNRQAGTTIFAAARQRYPFDYDNDGFSEIGKTNMKSIGFRSFYKPVSNHKLTVEYHTINEFRRGGNNFIKPPHEADIAEQTNHTIHSGGFKYDLFFDEYKHALQLYSSLQDISRESYYGSGKDPNAYGSTQDLSLTVGTQYKLRMEQLWFMPATFIAGAEYSYNALNDEMIGYNRTIDQKIGIYSVFAQNEWRNERASFLLGLRTDKHTMIAKPIVSPRVSVRYAPLQWLNLRAGYAGGYRGPQAFDEDLHVTAVGEGVALITVAENLKPETSQSLTFSAELSQTYENTAFMFLAEGFYTRLNNVFLLEETGKDADGNLHLERRNGSGATVAGVNLEANVIPFRYFQVNAGFTIQSSLYHKPEQWSETVEPQRKMFRAPHNYGYLTALYLPKEKLELSLSGTYTGTMLVQHFAGYIPQDAEVKTPAFFDMALKAAYNFDLTDNLKLQLNIGVKNVFNSYQSDFDRGEFRDAGYIYGPALPRTVFFGAKMTM